MSKKRIITITTTEEVAHEIKFEISEDLMDRVDELVKRLSYTSDWEKHIALFVVNEIKASLEGRAK